MAKKKQAPASPKPEGRPPWEPTDVERGKVQAYAEAGYSQEDIAERLDVDRQTLTKHCGHILKWARMDLLSQVSRQAFRMAIGAPAQHDDKGNQIRAEVLPQAWAICFVLKTIGKKLGFTERLELTGKNGAPLVPELSALMAQMKDEEIAVLADAQRILAKYAPGIADQSGDRPTTH
jgi:hypothetical protein